MRYCIQGSELQGMRYSVQGSGLRYSVQGLGLRCSVQGLGLTYSAQSLGLWGVDDLGLGVGVVARHHHLF